MAGNKARPGSSGKAIFWARQKNWVLPSSKAQPVKHHYPIKAQARGKLLDKARSPKIPGPFQLKLHFYSNYSSSNGLLNSAAQAYKFLVFWDCFKLYFARWWW